MLGALVGKKVGMTQVFDREGNVVPVTVIDMACWYITQFKTIEKDGYAAVQIGLLKEKHQAKSFSSDWLKNKKQYFSCFKEVALQQPNSEFFVGQEVTFKDAAFEEGVEVAVMGMSKGLGFQGVTKRWNFGRGPSTHGSMFHRRPGSIGNLCKEGEVQKGKKLPGHKGFRQVTVRGLKVVKADQNARCLFVKGAVPGKKDSVIVVSKQG